MAYCVTNEGILELKNLKNRLLQSISALNEANNELKTAISSNPEGAGPHYSRIEQLCSDLENSVTNATDPVFDLCDCIDILADTYDDIINTSYLDFSGRSDQGNTFSLSEMKGTSDTGEHSPQYSDIISSLNSQNVEYYKTKQSEVSRSSADIIQRISGGDNTEGSCSSVALAYTGNKAGYDVLDFRGGASGDFFSRRSSIEKIANLPGVISNSNCGRNDLACINDLLDKAAPDKEYYLAAAEHAAIVRRNGSGFEYLELQHPSDGNGWKKLNDNILHERFGAELSPRDYDLSNFLIDIDSLAGSKEFIDILGYINTEYGQQKKGRNGSIL